MCNDSGCPREICLHSYGPAMKLLLLMIAAKYDCSRCSLLDVQSIINSDTLSLDYLYFCITVSFHDINAVVNFKKVITRHNDCCSQV